MQHRSHSTTLLAAVTVLAHVAFASVPQALAYVDPSTGFPTATQVLRGFEPPEQRWLAGHRGVDLALPVGASVRAAGDGVVHFAGSVAGKPVVSIKHDDGIRTTYQPVFARVKKGEHVKEGDVIGTLAPSVDGYPGLHWGAMEGREDYIDPLGLLGEPAIRLKPVGGNARRRP
ncbi:M23 family metallopeptidase [Corynebacterium minutissimum]